MILHAERPARWRDVRGRGEDHPALLHREGPCPGVNGPASIGFGDLAAGGESGGEFIEPAGQHPRVAFVDQVPGDPEFGGGNEQIDLVVMLARGSPQQRPESGRFVDDPGTLTVQQLGQPAGDALGGNRYFDQGWVLLPRPRKGKASVHRRGYR